MTEKWFYNAREVGRKLNWSPQYIRDAARGLYNFPPLPFPTLVHGTRVQIPKAPFDEWFRKQQEVTKE